MIIACAALFCASCGPDNKCHSATLCLNGGVCMDNACTCPTGFDGADCGIDTRDKFVGNWTQNPSGGDTAAFPISIMKGDAAPKVIVSNFDNNIQNKIVGEMSDKNTVVFHTYDVTGTLTYNPNKTMTIKYSIKDASGGVKSVMADIK